MNHATETLTSSDGTRLHLYTWTPEQPARAVVGIIPGWSDHGGRYMNLVNRLLLEGFAVFALDLRGHGRSDGARGHIMRWEEYRHDVDTLVGTLAARYPDLPLFVFGHSLGGLATMDYAVHHPTKPIRGLVLSAPLLAPPNVNPALRQLGTLLSRIAPAFSLNPGTDPNTVSRDPAVVASYRDDPLGHDLASARFATEMPAAQQFVLANLDGVHYPLLLVYGSADNLVPPHISRDMFQQLAAEDKTRREYEGGYHEIINDLVRQQALDEITAWINERC